MFSKYFGDRDFWRITIRLALPIAMQNLLMSSFSLVDTIMVGQLGTIALSAVGMAGQWSWLMNMMIFGICSGVAVYVSQYWGVRDTEGIHKIYGISLLSALGVSLLFLLIAFFLPHGVIWIFNREPSIVAAGSAYLRIAAWSYPASVVSNVMGTVLRSAERVKLPMYASFFTTVLNGFLDYGLIFGAFGLPVMGVEGAALATCISAWLSPIIIFVVSLVQRNILIAPFRKLFCFGRRMVVDFYKRVAPIIFNESMWGIGTICYNIIFSNLGYEYFAAITILRTFENIAFVFLIGLCSACCIMVGKSVGAGTIRCAVMDARRFAFLIPLFGMCMGGLIVLFRPQLIHLFNFNGNITDLTVQTAMGMMLIYGLECVLRVVPYIQIVGIFRSGGDTVTGVKYDLLCLWCCSLPVTFLTAFVLRLPVLVVFLCMYLFEDVIKSVLCLRHFLSLRWIKPVTAQGRAGLRTYRAEQSGQ